MPELICTHCENKYIGRTDKRCKNTFCSRSCSASYNNNKFPKRQVEPQNQCNNCGTWTAANLCRTCLSIKKVQDYAERTLQECIDSTDGWAAKHRYQPVRNHAHKYARFMGWTGESCEVCQYSNHVELCHVKPISEFSLDTKLKIINNKSNIRFLCPNHHWELDNGILM